MEILESVLSYNLIHTAIRHSTPILLAAVAVIITQKSGVLNVGIEGIMTLGAFSAIVVSHFSGSPVLAVLCAAGAGALVAYVIGVAHLKFGADVFAVGMTINIFAVSLSIFLLSMLFGIRGSFKPDDLQTLPDIHIPALESSPVLDSLFNDYSLFEILAIAMVFMLRFYLNHTASGLRLQSVGLNEAAAETAGININRTKFYALLFSGVVGGLAGAHLSLGYANFFIPTIVSGRGFMGIAAMFFAGANPFISWLACLLFGMIDSIGARLQVYGLPSEFVMMMPYIATVAVLSVSMYIKKRRRQKQSSSIENGRSAKGHRATAIEQSRKAKR